jgi:hypothetical protein
MELQLNNIEEECVGFETGILGDELKRIGS